MNKYQKVGMTKKGEECIQRYVDYQGSEGNTFLFDFSISSLRWQLEHDSFCGFAIFIKHVINPLHMQKQEKKRGNLRNNCTENNVQKRNIA